MGMQLWDSHTAWMINTLAVIASWRITMTCLPAGDSCRMQLVRRFAQMLLLSPRTGQRAHIPIGEHNLSHLRTLPAELVHTPLQNIADSIPPCSLSTSRMVSLA